MFLLLARFLFRSAYQVDPDKAQNMSALDERKAIRNPALLRKVLAVLAVILTAFARTTPSVWTRLWWPCSAPGR